MRLYKAAELVELKKILSEKLEDWAQKWLSPEGVFIIERVSAFQCGIDTEVSNGLYIDISDCSMVELLAGEKADLNIKDESLLQKIWLKAEQDAAEYFSAQNHKNTTLTELSEFGSGSICAECMFGTSKINFVFSIDIINSVFESPNYIPCTSSISSIPNALSDQKITVTLHTNELKCDYQQIKNLKAGDVIKIDHSVREPLKISINGNKDIAKAFLARSGSLKTAVIED